MMQKSIKINTNRQGLYEITNEINSFVMASHVDPRSIKSGICNVFVKHTSASLIICENADQDVLHDLEQYFKRLVKDNEPYFKHTLEGPDDMSAHIKSVLTGCSLSIPFTNNKLNIGTWQGIFLWEHRTSSHNREIIVTIN